MARRRFFRPVVERTSKGFVLHLDDDEIGALEPTPRVAVTPFVKARRPAA